MSATVSPQSVIALSVLVAKDMGKPLEIEMISRVLFDLKKQGFNVGDVAFRRVPGGVHSEDVEAFVGRLLSAGYARARSPIEFFEDGIRVCETIIDDERRNNAFVFDEAAKLVKQELQLA